MSAGSRLVVGGRRRRLGVLAVVAVVAGVLVGVSGSLAAAGPVEWGPGLSVVGGSYVDPVDVALSVDQRYLFLLYEDDRVEKIDTEENSSSLLTSGDEIEFGHFIAVRSSDGAVLVSSSGSSTDRTVDPKLIEVDPVSGDQTVLRDDLGVAGPIGWHPAAGRILTAERKDRPDTDDQDHLVSLDSSGADLVDLDRAHYPGGWAYDIGGARLGEVRVDPDGQVLTQWDEISGHGYYVYDRAVWAFTGDVETPVTPWTGYAKVAGLFRVGRMNVSPVNGWIFGSQGIPGAWNAEDADVHVAVAFGADLRPSRSYFGFEAYEGTDFDQEELPPEVSPVRIAGGAGPGSATGVPGQLSSPGGLAVKGLDSYGSESLVFVADTGNDRVVVIHTPRLLELEERQGYLASAKRVSDPVDTATGNFADSFVDLAAQGGVFGVEVGRAYNSTDFGGSGELGPGWRGPFSQTLRPDMGVNWRLVLGDGRHVVFRPDGSGGWVRPREFGGSLTGSPPSGVSFPSGETWGFDSNGFLTSMSRWDGQSLTISRASSGSGQIVGVVSSVGPTLSFTYDASSGRLTQIETGDGRTVSYGYDAATQFLESVTGPDGHVTTYDTDDVGRVIGITDPTGVPLVVNTFDARGRVVEQVTPSGDTTFAYDDYTGETVVTTEGIGEEVTFAHDPLGRVVGLEDPSGHTASRSYGVDGFIESGTDRSGSTVSTDFDAVGNPVSALDPASGTTSYTYDSSGRVVSSTSPTSGTTTFTYTGANRIPSTVTDGLGKVTTNTVVGGLLVSTTDPDGVTFSYTYTPLRQMATVTDELGHVTTYGYDAAGRVESVTSPEGRVTQTTHDGAGRPLVVTAADGGETTFTYDAAGRVLHVEDPTGATTTNTYNSDGLLVSTALPGRPATLFSYTDQGELHTVTEPAGGGTVTSTYGTLGRLVSVEDQTGGVTSFGYDSEGRVTSVTAADGGVWTTVFNAAGQRTSAIDPLGRATTYTYLPSGQLQKITSPGGGETSYTYDAVGRVVTTTDPTGIVTTTSYTDAGRTESVATPAGTTSYTYDAAGRLVAVTDPSAGVTTFDVTGDGLTASVETPGGLTTSYTYDAAGRVATVTDAAGVVTTNTWSLRGELSSEARSGMGTASYVYNADGTMATATDRRGNVTSFAYDDLGRLTSRTNALGGVDAWTYDAASRVTSHTPPQITGQALHPTTTTYDPVGRVAAVADSSGRSVTDTYDVAGQLTTRTATDGVDTLSLTYGYDLDGRLTSATGSEGTATWTYDDAGRVLSATTAAGRTTEYSYDTAARLDSVTRPDGTRLSYAYDSANRITAVTPTALLADSFTAPDGSPVDAAKWTAQSNASGNSLVDTNAAVLSVADIAHSTATLKSNGAAVSDLDLSFTYSFADLSPDNQLRLRAYSRYTDAANNYRLEISSHSTTARFYETVAGVTTQISSFSIPSAPAGTPMGVRFETTGTTLRAKVWDRTAGGEPSAWTKTVTDSSLSGAGLPRVQAARGSGSNSVTVDDVSYVDPNHTPDTIAAFSYDSDGHVTSESLPGGSRTWTWIGGRVAAMSQSLPDAVGSTTLTYDSAGLLASDTTGGTTTMFGYDAAGEVVSVAPSGGPVVSYSYDALGRRTNRTAGGVSSSYAYNEASQLVSVSVSGGSVSSFSYDAAGRRVGETDGTTSAALAYDALGRLASVTRDGVIETRGYDPGGGLAAVVSGGETTLLDWDAVGSVPRLSGWQSDGATTGLVDGPAGWVSTRVASVDTGLAVDVYGSVLSTPQTAAAALAEGYDEFGDTTVGSLGDPRLGYRGEATVGGLVHLRARDYDASSGVFTTVDPLGDVVGTPTVGNPYHYTNNSPLNAVDPLGLRSSDVDTNLSACRDAGGHRLVTYGGRGKMCVFPPLSGRRGDFCAPPMTSRGEAFIYDGRGSCGYWTGGGCESATIEFLCRHHDEIIKTIAATAVGMICAAGGAAGGVGGAGAAGNVCFGAVKRGLDAYQNGANSWAAAFSPRNVVTDAAVGAGTALALAGAGKGAQAINTSLRNRAASSVATNTVDDLLPGLPAGAPKPLGLGSTGRVTPGNLTEQLAMTEVRAAPAGRQLGVTMTDARWPAADGWVKMSQNVNGVEIHYVQNTFTGAVDDFKFIGGAG